MQDIQQALPFKLLGDSDNGSECINYHLNLWFGPRWSECR
jgi:hypothetical protein